jgi:hypothetical protein
MEHRVRGLSGVSFMGELIPFMRAYALITSSYPKALTTITITLGGVRISKYELWRDTNMMIDPFQMATECNMPSDDRLSLQKNASQEEEKEEKNGLLYTILLLSFFSGSTFFGSGS